MLFKIKPIPNYETYKARYLAGESAKALAKEIGIKAETLVRRFKADGVTIRLHNEIFVPDLDKLIQDYVNGTSLAELSRETGIERIVLTKRFKRAGVHLRNRSEAEKLKWNQYKGDPKIVRRLLQKAWDACRGRTETDKTKALRAETRYKRQTHIFYFENEIAATLRKKGCSIKQQFPVSQFSVDIVFEDIKLAVEIINSGWESAARRNREAERAQEILKAGWSILYIKTYNGSGYSRRSVLDMDAVTDFIISYAQRLIEDESLQGRYAVVRGDCILLTTRNSTLGDLPKVYYL